MIFKRVLVCGGSHNTPWAAVLDALDELAANLRQEAALLNNELHLTIIHEGRGSDVGSYADGWAVANKVSTEEFSFEWMPAGLERNENIIELGRPDVVLAFVGNPSSLDLIGLSRKAGIVVHLLATSSHNRQKDAPEQHSSSRSQT
ncbi:hypothetical protein [Antarcticirhabdus aurantiaca]|uniref:hypothetical protein n=1 Tax=Antarcticirhabdus aurantiaca TaxID=2606717 RepID=UPI00131EC794|nr:hypothetical protein [Antarcticirhabdus aurantiaca]